MKSIFAPAAAALLLAGNALAQLTINTPGPAVLCQPLLITWTGGTPPYFLSILPGNQPSAAALIDFPQTTSLSQRWVVNITAGTTLGLDLRDNTGIVAQSAPFTIQASSDTSCLNGGSTTSGSSSTGGTTTSSVVTPPATTSPTNTPTAPVTTTSGTSPGTTTGGTTSTTGTTSAPKTSTTSSATGNMANAGLVGAFGIGAALMALVF